MRRYTLNQKISVGDIVTIKQDLFKHIFKVCRRSEGDGFELLSKGFAYLVQVKLIDKNCAKVFIKSRRKVIKIKKPYIHLVLANPRPAVFENVIEKAVELGVKSVYPITTKKSFFKNIEKLKLKDNRIQKIITQAMQQTGRCEDLKVHKAFDLESFLKEFKRFFDDGQAKGFIFYEALDAKPLEFHSEDLCEKCENIFILIGGEGGFLEKEVFSATLVGFQALLLGKQILKVETACVAGISILKSKFKIW